MKSILVVIILIITLILVDHFKLLRPKPGYPAPVNKLIQAINQGDFSDLEKFNLQAKKPGEMLNPNQEITKPEPKTLYQWRSEEGVWQISDQPPEGKIYQTINLTAAKSPLNKSSNDYPETPTHLNDQQLIQASQCQFYLEQIDHYKNKMRFGGPGHVISHWERQIDWYTKLSLKSCTGEISEKP